MKHLRILLIIPVYLLFFAGTCRESAEQANKSAEQPGGSYTVPVKGFVTITQGALKREIYFDSVVMDNRCPPNVNCIVAGEGVCTFTVRNGTQSQQITLSTYPGGTGAAKYPREGEVSDLRIRLEALTPFPRGAYGDYKAQLIVTAVQ